MTGPFSYGHCDAIAHCHQSRAFYNYAMPYEWSHTPATNRTDWTLSLWPYRSLLRRDFVIFVGGTAVLVALPLIVLVGTMVIWALLPFIGLMLFGLWMALQTSYKRGEILEELTATRDHIHLRRQNPDGSVQEWSANRYWATAHLHPKEGPVEQYITLRGGPREVELGAFLDVNERIALYAQLTQALVTPQA